jgi:chromosome segregation ATPase
MPLPANFCLEAPHHEQPCSKGVVVFAKTLTEFDDPVAWLRQRQERARARLTNALEEAARRSPAEHAKLRKLADAAGIENLGAIMERERSQMVKDERVNILGAKIRLAERTIVSMSGDLKSLKQHRNKLAAEKQSLEKKGQSP